MFVLVNLKSYDCDPVAIARAAAEVADDNDVRIAVAPPTARLQAVADTGVETWAQHVAPTGHGSHTGSQSASAAAAAGATGTLVNHSERRLTLAALDGAIERARDAELETVACAGSPAQVAAASALAPDAVAVEPPELIGSGTPVSRADPEIVEQAVRAADRPVYCGAGISTGEDVAAAAELGARGVLLASGVAKAADPRAVLADLAAGVR